jgi:hypothetical protein
MEDGAESPCGRRAIEQALRQQFEPARQDAELARLHEILVNQAAALFVVHDLNPRALASRIGGFVQSRNWFQGYTAVTIRGS